jgi:hypothetical protein
MKKTTLLIAAFSFMMSPLFSQITVQTKEVKSIEVIKKEIQDLEKQYEFIESDTDTEKVFFARILGYKTHLINFSGNYYIKLELEGDRSDKDISLYFLEDIESIVPSDDNKNVVIYYPMSKLDFVLDQLDKEACQIVYIYKTKLSVLIAQ